MSNYSEKLKDPRWQKKRLKVFERDKFACQFCGSTEYMLCVHHKTYRKGKNPWEYALKDLITMCDHCHNKLSKNTLLIGEYNSGDSFPVYPEDRFASMEASMSCPICGCENIWFIKPKLKTSDNYEAWSGKGDKITIPMFCDNGCTFFFNFGSHKGLTFVFYEDLKTKKI